MKEKQGKGKKSGLHTKELLSLPFGHKVCLLIASGLGIGFIPIAPGTFGSLLGILPPLLLRNFEAASPLVLLLLSVASIPFIVKAGKVLRCTDASIIVLDEVLGMWLSLLSIPLTVPNVILCFLLFRLFDILKPFPIKWIEDRVPGGAGVLMDDLAAGALANLSARLLIFLVGH